MRGLRLAFVGDRPLRVLCLGAHCDDIEIGCGGTILTMARQDPRLVVDWVVLSGDDERAREAQRSADAFLSGVAARRLTVERFRDGYLPYQGERLKDYFESLKGRGDPDLVFAPFREDCGTPHWRHVARTGGPVWVFIRGSPGRIGRGRKPG